jgi:predicted nucleic acid-binding Zn ribbon protein
MTPKEKRGGRPVSLGTALRAWLDDAGLGRRLELTQALDHWAAAVGPQVAAVTQPESVNAQGILWVRVASSAWANELSLMSPRILAQLNQLGARQAQIREIRWLVGPRDASDLR